MLFFIFYFLQFCDIFPIYLDIKKARTGLRRSSLSRDGLNAYDSNGTGGFLRIRICMPGTPWRHNLQRRALVPGIFCDIRN